MSILVISMIIGVLLANMAIGFYLGGRWQIHVDTLEQSRLSDRVVKSIDWIGDRDPVCGCILLNNLDNRMSLWDLSERVRHGLITKDEFVLWRDQHYGRKPRINNAV